ncbi:hypothetical protein [Streptomyces sp. NPDC059479]|uniref:hypothetical protein n=1 Tax=Streptomyces sp. NPDC059479 TaxID=3346848 RepID=UPI0036AF9ABB
MRDSIARALVWVLRMVLPAKGDHRAPNAATPEPAPVRAWSKPWTGISACQARAIFHAEETRTLTPEQREHWWAAAFHEIGVDYDYPTLNITPARSGHRMSA